MTGKLPALIIGGYLGAGKTTLVNHLLRHAAGRRIAVMVNDFGQINIDAALIESRDGEVMTLTGGCICCAFGSDLIGALMALPERVQPPDLVLIETSGVALPGAVARSVRLVPGIAIDGVVVMVDAETIRARMQDRHVGETVSQQIAQADLLVLNKVELLASPALDALRDWLVCRVGRVPIITTTEARIPPDLLLGLSDGEPPPGAGNTLPSDTRRQAPGTQMGSASRAAAIFASASFDVVRTVDAQALAQSLTDPALGVIRAKGLVRDRSGDWRAVQIVGPRLRITPVIHGETPAEADSGQTRANVDANRSGRLVVIGLRGQLDATGVRARLEAASAEMIPL